MALPHCLTFLLLLFLGVLVLPEAAGVARLPEAVKVMPDHILMV